MRFAWNIALVAGLGVSQALGQEDGNATGAQQSAGFPTLYQSRSVEIVSFGYIRAGIGWRDGGDAPQRCLQLPDSPVKYRLGNECEIYFEPGIEFAFGDLDGAHVDLQLCSASIGHCCAKR